MYKNNSRESSNFKGCSPLQLSCNLTGKGHAFGYIFLYLTLGASVKQNIVKRLKKLYDLEGLKKVSCINRLMENF